MRNDPGQQHGLAAARETLKIIAFSLVDSWGKSKLVDRKECLPERVHSISSIKVGTVV